MTRNYKFFASADPDAPTTYNQATFARFLAMHFADGIFDGVGNNLVVGVTDPVAMTVTVDTGAMMIQGYMLEGTELETLSIAAADASNPRYDRVVVRLDTSVNLDISYAVLTGMPASTPVLPTLTQTAYIYEMPLATVMVTAGVTSITAEDIIDERVYRDVTNLFHGAVSTLSNLGVGGDLVVDGDLDVKGDAIIRGLLTFTSSHISADVTGNLTGNVTGKISMGVLLCNDATAHGAKLISNKVVLSATGTVPETDVLTDLQSKLLSTALSYVDVTGIISTSVLRFSAGYGEGGYVTAYIKCYDSAGTLLSTSGGTSNSGGPWDVVIPVTTNRITGYAQSQWNTGTTTFTMEAVYSSII